MKKIPFLFCAALQNQILIRRPAIPLSVYDCDFSTLRTPDYIPQIFCFLEGHCIDRTPRGALDTADLLRAECR